MTTEEMQALSACGLSYREIGQRANISHQAVYYRLGGKRTPPKPANDNHPDRVTRDMPYNGGCSTTSGMQAISLKRVPTLDGAALGAVA